MSKAALLAMLSNTMKTLLTVANGRVAERVEGIVNPIYKDAHASEVLLIIQPTGLESPKIEAHLRRILNVEHMPRNFMHDVTSTIMFNRVFRTFTTKEYASVGG